MKWGHCRVRRLKRQRLRPLASVKTPGELPQNWLWGPQLNKVMGSWKMHSEGCACTPFWLTSCHGDRWKQKVEKLDWIPVLLFLSFFFFFLILGFLRITLENSGIDLDSQVCRTHERVRKNWDLSSEGLSSLCSVHVKMYPSHFSSNLSAPSIGNKTN